jgi:hypothetical protein
LGFTNVFRKQFTELFPHPSLLLSLSLKKKKREERKGGAPWSVSVKKY